MRLYEFFKTEEFKNGRGEIVCGGENCRHFLEKIGEYAYGKAWSCLPGRHIESMKDMKVLIYPSF